MKYIVVCGSVISGIGKGIVASSLGLLLQCEGHRVTAVKIDPYLNVDAGTMSPQEHGECFVLADGAEADLDLGNYERFLHVTLRGANNITTGKVYQRVIAKERQGHYLGKTVQVVPHVTDEVLTMIEEACQPRDGEPPADVCIVELGGVLGDMEGLPFVQALSNLGSRGAVAIVHVTMGIDKHDDFKTKPIQAGIRKARKLGLTPDVVVVRCASALSHAVKAKVHAACQVPMDAIVSNTDVPHLYHVPRLLKDQGALDIVRLKLNLHGVLNMDTYMSVLDYYSMAPSLPPVTVGIVGKYLGNPDTYLSLTRAIEHAAWRAQLNVTIRWVSTDAAIDADSLAQLDAVVIPGGFGARGVPEKMAAARVCHIAGIPVLGICLGMQVMVAVAWNDSGRAGGSTEWRDAGLLVNDLEEWETWTPIIDVQPGKGGDKGGTMRLGNYTTLLQPGSVAAQAYHGDTRVVERHRHRYEVNPACVEALTTHTYLSVSGQCEHSGLVEVVEDASHPFYVGVQYHPEYHTRYDAPHPLFVALLKAKRDH